MNPEFLFRLYIAGDSMNSVRARSNLVQIIREFVAGPYMVEVIDLLKDPRRAMADDVIVTPTLIKIKPGPARRVLGNLSERDKVVEALGLSPKA